MLSTYFSCSSLRNRWNKVNKWCEYFSAYLFGFGSWSPETALTFLSFDFYFNTIVKLFRICIVRMVCFSTMSSSGTIGCHWNQHGLVSTKYWKGNPAKHKLSTAAYFSFCNFRFVLPKQQSNIFLWNTLALSSGNSSSSRVFSKGSGTFLFFLNIIG